MNKLTERDLQDRLRDALECYAESYDTMARIGSDGKVECTSVAYDIRKNMVDSVLSGLARRSTNASPQGDERLASHDAAEQQVAEAAARRADRASRIGIAQGDELPPLPSDVANAADWGGRDSSDLYTADQMREYGAACRASTGAADGLTVSVPVEAYLWLMGMGSDGFTEDRRGAFWWRGAFNERAGLDMMGIYEASKAAARNAQPGGAADA